MKLQLKCKCQPPYGGGFGIDQPEKGWVGYGSTFEMLVMMVKKYRTANAIPIGLGFEDELEAAICAKYPTEAEWVDETIPQTLVLGMTDVLRGTRVLAGVVSQWALSKLGLAESPLVDESTAQARAQVCAGCQYNTPMRLPCGGVCGELKDLVNTIRGSRAIAETPGPKACSICSCLSDIHVHIRQDILDLGTTETMKAQFGRVPWCWKGKAEMGKSESGNGDTNGARIK